MTNYSKDLALDALEEFAVEAAKSDDPILREIWRAIVPVIERHGWDRCGVHSVCDTPDICRRVFADAFYSEPLRPKLKLVRHDK